MVGANLRHCNYCVRCEYPVIDFCWMFVDMAQSGVPVQDVWYDMSQEMYPEVPRTDNLQEVTIIFQSVTSNSFTHVL